MRCVFLPQFCSLSVSKSRILHQECCVLGLFAIGRTCYHLAIICYPGFHSTPSPINWSVFSSAVQFSLGNPSCACREDGMSDSIPSSRVLFARCDFFSGLGEVGKGIACLMLQRTPYVYQTEKELLYSKVGDKHGTTCEQVAMQDTALATFNISWTPHHPHTPSLLDWKYP